MKVPASHHRLVSLAIMETFVRYNRVLQHSQHCLPSVLQTFLGDKGIGHPDKVIDQPPSSSVHLCYSSALHHRQHFWPGMLQACLIDNAIIHPGKEIASSHVPIADLLRILQDADGVLSSFIVRLLQISYALTCTIARLHGPEALPHHLPSNVQAVGTRACYLFSRLAKSLRQNLRPLLSDILVRLQPHLAHILANPLPEAEPATKGAASSAGL